MASTRILSQLQSAEARFLAAMAAGEDAVSTFSETWASLLLLLTTHDVDAQTKSIAHTTASRIAILAETFLSLDTEADKAWSKLEAKIAYHAEHDSVLSPSERPGYASTLMPSSGDRDTPAPIDRILNAVAGRWLLSNLHDPYPSSSDKLAIATDSLCSIQDVQAWFSDARRRIGWTALSRERYGGSRRATSDAASCAYVEDKTVKTLPFDVQRAFSRIQAIAYSLYAMDPESYLEILDGEDSEAFEIGAGDEEPCSSLHPPLSDEEEDTTPPPPLAGRKRCFDSTAELGNGSPHLVKRPRCTSTREDAVTTPAIPAMQDTHLHGVTDKTQSYHPAVAFDPPVYPHEAGAVTFTTAVPEIGSQEMSVSKPARKRRLTDAALPDSLKRPRSLMGSPRRQSVPNPPPASNLDIGDLQSNCSLLEDLNMGAQDASASFDVGMDWAKFATISHDMASPVLDGPFAQFNVSDADLNAATLAGFDFSVIDFAGSLGASSSLDYPASPFIHTPTSMDGFSTSLSPLPVQSSPGLSDYELMDYFLRDDRIAGQSPSPSEPVSLSPFPSPTSSASSLSDSTALSQHISNIATSNPDIIHYTQFGPESSSASLDLLFDFGELSSLRNSLEVVS